jgi:hypothetical protein
MYAERAVILARLFVDGADQGPHLFHARIATYGNGNENGGKSGSGNGSVGGGGKGKGKGAGVDATANARPTPLAGVTITSNPRKLTGLMGGLE